MERLPRQEPCGCDAGGDECERRPQPREIRPFIRELELRFRITPFAHVRTPLSRCREPSAWHLTDLATWIGLEDLSMSLAPPAVWRPTTFD